MQEYKYNKNKWLMKTITIFIITQQNYCYRAEMLDGLRHLQIIKILGVTYTNGFSVTLHAQQYRPSSGLLPRLLAKFAGVEDSQKV